LWSILLSLEYYRLFGPFISSSRWNDLLRGALALCIGSIDREMLSGRSRR
jgi:hypothetical protein